MDNESILTRHLFIARKASEAKHHREAVESYLVALEEMDGIGENDGSRRAEALLRLGLTYCYLGKPLDAMTRLEQGLAIKEKQN